MRLKTGILKAIKVSYNGVYWRGAGVVERARLENENSRKAIEGSNPSLSAQTGQAQRLPFFILLRP
jgi:hypothetical protein